jgi:dTDP-4-dehydrorhamnose reductase
VDICNFQELLRVAGTDDYSYILNTAAYTNVQLAESDRERAYEVNVTGSRNLALIGRLLDIPILHFSTDYVFAGEKRDLKREKDFRDPKNYYGETKKMGEDEFLDIYPEGSTIVRTSSLYSQFGDNFVKRILNVIDTADVTEVVNANSVSPTWATDLVFFVYQLIVTKSAPGIYHGVNSGNPSSYEFAKKVLDLAGIDARKIQPVEVAKPGSLLRPQFAALTQSRVVGFPQLRSWDQALTEFYNQTRFDFV